MKQKPDCFDIPGRRKRLDLDKRRGAARSIAPVPVTSMQRLGQRHHRYCQQPAAKGMNAKSVTLKSASHFSVSTMGPRFGQIMRQVNRYHKAAASQGIDFKRPFLLNVAPLPVRMRYPA